MEEEKKDVLPPDNGGEPKPSNTGTEPATLDAVVAELKEIRKERAFYKEAFESMMKKPEETPAPEQKPEPTEVEKTVLSVLQQQEAARVKAMKQATLERFFTENKEYHPDNDPTGLKRQALVNKLAMFNTDGILTESQFLSVITDANRLAGGSGSQTKIDKDINPYSVTPTSQSPGGQPTKDSDLSDVEKAMLQRTGYSVEKYRTLKEKNPDFVKQLLNPYIG